MLFNSVLMTFLVLVIVVAAGYHVLTSWEFKYCYHVLDHSNLFSKPNRVTLARGIQETLKDVRLYMVIGFLIMLPSLIVIVLWYVIQLSFKWVANIPIYRKR